MAKYDSTIFGEARSETADRRSGRTERITRNESSADFLLAVSQPVRQTFYLQSGNRLGSRDRPSGTPSSPANGRAGFVPFGLGPKSWIIGSFPAARMLRPVCSHPYSNHGNGPFFLRLVRLQSLTAFGPNDRPRAHTIVGRAF